MDPRRLGLRGKIIPIFDLAARMGLIDTVGKALGASYTRLRGSPRSRGLPSFWGLRASHYHELLDV